MKRPAGITLIAVVFIILAALSLLWSGLVFGLGGLGAAFGGLLGADAVSTFGTSSAWSGFVGILAALVHIATGIGLLMMKKWAWYLALAAVALTVVEGVLGIFGGGAVAFMCGILGLIVPVAILIYLVTKKVRGVFGIGSLTPA
jgi:hypothetical protein